MEAWRRELDDPVSAFPIEKAGPAHIATLKTFDPPLAALEGRRLSGAERRAKRLLFPTEDGELVLLVHLMTAGRLRYLLAGEKGPKTPAFRLAFEGGAELVLTEAGKKKRAGVWLLDARGGRGGARAPRPGGERGRRRRSSGEILAGESRRLHSLLRDQRVIAGIGRAWANEILHAAKLSPYALSRDVEPGGGRAARDGDRRRSSRAASSCGSAARTTSGRTASTTSSASRATSAGRRSRRSTSRSTRSTTAPSARPAAGRSRTAACRGSCDKRPANSNGSTGRFRRSHGRAMRPEDGAARVASVPDWRPDAQGPPLSRLLR